jgi:hypothetical protein
MTRLHTFGCSISQGFALPDVVKPVLDDQGQPLTGDRATQRIEELGIHWSDIHLYQPSKFAWPQQLGNQLNVPVINHARRGACFQQIARQCAAAAKDIGPDDVVIVMWTYMSRLSLQWPARTAVPFCNIADPNWGWKTVILGFNKLFGLEHSKTASKPTDDYIQRYIEQATKYTYLDPMGVYNRYYNSLVLQSMTDGFLRATGARVIHLSVETEPLLDQLESARTQLDSTLREPYRIPDPAEWYSVPVDYDSCHVILDDTIPPAENDMHPSVTHHALFADNIHNKYFKAAD